MSGFKLETKRGRLAAYLDFLWRDHAYLRLGFQNAHLVSDELVRSNQPWPHQLRAWKRCGIRTIVNLRGGFDASFHALEKDACAALGLTLINFTITSRDAPSREQILAAANLFETVEYPILIHCKSGADRASMMSALYVHLRMGADIPTAMRQLDLRYLPSQRSTAARASSTMCSSATWSKALRRAARSSNGCKARHTIRVRSKPPMALDRVAPCSPTYWCGSSRAQTLCGATGEAQDRVTCASSMYPTPRTVRMMLVAASF